MAACATTQTDLNTAKTNFQSAQTTLDTAKHTLDVDDTSSRTANETARQTVIHRAETRATPTAPTRPPNIAAQQGRPGGQRPGPGGERPAGNLDNTVLYAPVAGTISSITGAVGEYVGQGGGTSAPGPPVRTPPIPGRRLRRAHRGPVLGVRRPGAPSAHPPRWHGVHGDQQHQHLPGGCALSRSPTRPRSRRTRRFQVTFDALPDLTRDGTVLIRRPRRCVDISRRHETTTRRSCSPTPTRGSRRVRPPRAGVLVSELDKRAGGTELRGHQAGRPLVRERPGPRRQSRSSSSSSPGLVGDDNNPGAVRP